MLNNFLLTFLATIPLMTEASTCIKTYLPGSSEAYVMDYRFTSHNSQQASCYCDQGDTLQNGGCFAGGTFELYSTKPIFTAEGRQGWHCGLLQRKINKSATGSVRAFCRTNE